MTFYYHLCSFCGQSFEGPDEEEVKRIRFGGHDCVPRAFDPTLTKGVPRKANWTVVS